MNNIYEHKSVNNLLLTFSIPATFALIIEILTSVVDTIFAGHIGLQSNDALTAMGIISPLLAVFTALQTLFAVSTSIMIARNLNNKEELSKNFVIGFTMSVIIAAVTSMGFYFFLKPILSALGADGDVFILAEQYLKIQLISNIFSSIGYNLAGCIRAFGYPKVEAVIVSLSVVINIIFNTTFVFLFSLGFTGIALGTLISEILCAIIAFIWLRNKKLWFSKIKIQEKEFIEIIYNMFKIDISQTLIQVLAGCTGFFLNTSLLNFGSMSFIAAWNVVQKIYTLMLMPIVGLSQGSQTILAYFSSTKSDNKVKNTFKLSIIYCGVYGLIATISIIFCGESILSLFGLAKGTKEIALEIVKIVFITFPFNGVLYTNMTFLQLTKRELASVMIALTRQVFLIVPLVITLPFLFIKINIGIEPVTSIFFSIPIADIFSMTIVVLLLKKKI